MFLNDFSLPKAPVFIVQIIQIQIQFGGPLASSVFRSLLYPCSTYPFLESQLLVNPLSSLLHRRFCQVDACLQFLGLLCPLFYVLPHLSSGCFRLDWGPQRGHAAGHAAGRCQVARHAANGRAGAHPQVAARRRSLFSAPARAAGGTCTRVFLSPPPTHLPVRLSLARPSATACRMRSFS